MRRKNILRHGLLCPALLALLSCGLPNPREDVRLGREVADAMEAQVGRYQDKAIDDYVASVARRAEKQVAESPFTYSYATLDQPEPNAFAAPGGYVYVSRGLLALAESEDELAGVLAHEIIHVEQRHSMKQMSRQVLPSILSLPGRIVGNLISRDIGRIINAPVGMVGSLRQARYGRGQESESDRLGQELVAAAGYDPASLAAILERMEALGESITGEKRQPSFFDSHPPTPDRSLRVREYAKKLKVASRPAEALKRDAFLKQIDGLIWGPNPAQGEFRKEAFFHPDLDITIAFPKGWKTMNTPTMAGAIAPEDDALTFYGIVGEGGDEDLKKIAAARREALEREAGLKPSRDETRDLSGHTAQLLAYTDNSGQKPMHIFFVWIALEGLVHQFVGLTPESYRLEVKATVESLRTLTEEERQSFEVRRIRIVKGRDGETLKELGSRTKNVLAADMTALINGLKPDVKLAAEQSIKIVQTSPYVTNQ